MGGAAFCERRSCHNTNRYHRDRGCNQLEHCASFHPRLNNPAWKTKPSWYLVAIEDKMIPPDAQRFMSKRARATVVEVKGSHAVYVSQPQAVASLIEEAAKAVAQ